MSSEDLGRTRPYLRRYPATILLMTAVGLAALLPSALNIPITPPNELSEFAPIPGQGKGSSNLSSLGLISRDRERLVNREDEPPLDLVPLPGQSKRTLKKCVGTPPRQTEDPMSPPCVAFFEGDNGGATWRGITGAEVRVVMNFISRNVGRVSDCAVAPAPDDEATVIACKAYMKFFNSRYQTYGRSVHLFAYHSNSNRAIEIQKAEVAEVDEKVSPFAIVPGVPGFVRPFSQEAVDRGIVVAGYASYDRAFYRQFAPLLVSYAPDFEDQAEQLAGYVCTKLVNRVARFSGNPTDVGKVRKFGFLSVEPRAEIWKKTLLDRCGVVADIYNGQDVASYAQMRTEDVTTVIPIGPNGQPIVFSNSAAGTGWSPEWLVPGTPEGLGLDSTGTARLYNQAQWDHAFGVSFDYRRDRREEQPHHKAYKEGCPECTGNGSPLIYDSLAMLFYGVQAAGPKLTPESMDKGLHAIRPYASTSPYRPAAYFTPGNHSYVKDAMEIWWDSRATAQDGSFGCYRLPENGSRFRSQDWRGSDDSLFSGSPPCQAPV